MNSDFTRSISFRFDLPVQLLSDDGTRRVVVEQDWTVTVYDGMSGALIVEHPNQIPVFRYITLSPDDRHLGLVLEAGRIAVAELGLPTALKTWAHYGNRNGLLVFSPDGQRVLHEYGDLVAVHSIEDQAAVPLRLAAPGHEAAAFSPDGEWLAISTWDNSTDDKDSMATVQLWELDRFEHHGHYRLSETHVRDVALSPDEKVLAAVSLDGKVVLLRAMDGAMLAETHLSETLYSVTWTPDGSQLAVGTGNGTIHALDADDLSSLSSFAAKVGRIDRMVFVNAGRDVLVTSNGEALRRLEWSTGAEVWSAHMPGMRMVWVSISPDEQMVAAADFRLQTALLLDAQSGAELRRWRTRGPCGMVTFSPDGRHLLISEGGPAAAHSLWSLEEGRFEWEHVPGAAKLFTPDGSRLIGGSGVRLDIYAVSSGDLIAGIKSYVRGALPRAITSDGQIVFGASYDGFVIWWDGRPLAGNQR